MALTAKVMGSILRECMNKCVAWMWAGMHMSTNQSMSPVSFHFTLLIKKMYLLLSLTSNKFFHFKPSKKLEGIFCPFISHRNILNSSQSCCYKARGNIFVIWVFLCYIGFQSDTTLVIFISLNLQFNRAC